jgi:hypothetical protein
MESEFSPTNMSPLSLYAFNYQCIMSSQWVGSAYEIMRLISARRLSSAMGSEFPRLHRDFEVVRVPLEKHEIARDQKAHASLLMQHRGEDGPDGELYHYRYDDPQRAHIMPMGVSSRGSIMWHALDLVANEARWIERLSLSERFLDAAAKAE